MRIVLSLFYALTFFFEKFSTWICRRLPFAVHVILSINAEEENWLQSNLHKQPPLAPDHLQPKTLKFCWINSLQLEPLVNDHLS